MKFDYDILFEFLPEEDKKYFLVWDNVFNPFLTITKTVIKNPIIETQYLVAIYRSPFEEKIIIPLGEYEKRVKQKNRDININKILN
jgi:hypothetical protein